MKGLVWLIVLGALAGIVVWFWKARERMKDKQRASEERFASFMAEVKPAVPVVQPVNEIPQQKLLFDAAGKAGEANEPVLSIQLYARLLARYPDTQFAAQAKSAVEAQKKRLAKA
jgi:hypothetical protein